MENAGTAPQPGRPWVGEDEIDLRQYLDVLIQWWREILAITLPDTFWWWRRRSWC